VQIIHLAFYAIIYISNRYWNLTIEELKWDILILQGFKAGLSLSLSYLMNNIYFREISNVEKCLRKSKMDKKNVQFSKVPGFY